MRRPWIGLTACALLAAVACSSTVAAPPPGSSPGSSSPGSSTAGTTPTSASAALGRDGVVPGYQGDVDATSPLIIRAAGPAPIPVTGTDTKVHVVYELEVLNFSPRPATLTGLETLDGGPNGEVVASVEGQALAERTILVVDPEPLPIAEIPVGRSALIMVDDVYATKADVPATFSHRLQATFGALDPKYAAIGALFPEGPVTQFGAAIATSTASPVVIGPPLAGDGWLAGNACCSLSIHRGTMAPIGGRINAAERYAIDWFQVDTSPAGEIGAGGVVASVHGDPTKNESYLAYGEPLLAVADGTVVKVVTDVPDSTVGAPPTLPLDQLGGNVVIIDIGGGVYALYAHLVPGSATVKVGDKVTRGQVIGKLGNSGNSSEAHLHFHLTSRPASLIGDNIPFEIDTLTLVGNYDGPKYHDGPDAGRRTNQLPLIASVVAFPEKP